jgi:DNA polymerase-3 subunit beta
MKVSCTKENLARGLGIVSHMVGTRTTLPVLNNILLKTEKGRLKLAATDLEIGISTWIGAKVDKDGAVTCPARLISEFTTTNTDKTINLELKDATLHLSSEHFKANIKGIEASEFPLIPEVKTGKEIEIGALDFRDAILKTVFACALDETRPVLAGIYFVLSGNQIKLVATDSYRLAEKTVNLISKDASSTNFIVPARTMAEISRLIDESIEKVTIKVGENQVQFKLGPTEVMSRLIEGNFPDYEQIIPTSVKTKLEISTANFANAIKMASFFARESANNVKIVIKKPKQVQVLAVSPQIGDNISNLEGNFTGEEIEIAFNAKFILDALQVIGSEKITFELAGPLSPGVIRPAKDRNYLYIIMPLRMEE